VVTRLSEIRAKILVLSGHGRYGPAVESLRASCDVVQTSTFDQAIDALRKNQFAAVFSDSGDFLPLERAVVAQQTNLILNTIGEGVCIVDGRGRCNWMNKKMQAWPKAVHDRVREKCEESFKVFSTQISPANNDPAHFNRSKRHAFNVGDQQFIEMICSPVINPSGEVVQIVAVVWDATGTRRLQQKIDAIDKAGRELVRLESDLMIKLNVGQRLKLLEDKIISFTKELMRFDHFVVRLLDRRTNKLEPVISVGIPSDALNVELFAMSEGNGISGYVASTGRSYICPDVERDPRYVQGLDHAKSSLTVPLTLHDRVIGVFNIESREKAAFNEDDRQFSEIFGRYVAIALNILDLMVVERVSTSHKVTDVVCSEVAGPLNDISSDATRLMEDYIGNDDLRVRLKAILDNVGTIRNSLNQAALGPNTSVLGAADVVGADDPALNGKRILVADDEPNIRTTIHDVLKKYRVDVTVACNGGEACAVLEDNDFDLVLSDIRMPDKNGYEVFAAARAKSLALPVILMTGFGYDPSHSVVRASQEGLQAVLFKPFKVEQLLSEIRKALTVP
jgi:CheY-like chemotaxis protein